MPNSATSSGSNAADDIDPFATDTQSFDDMIELSKQFKRAECNGSDENGQFFIPLNADPQKYPGLVRWAHHVRTAWSLDQAKDQIVHLLEDNVKLKAQVRALKQAKVTLRNQNTTLKSRVQDLEAVIKNYDITEKSKNAGSGSRTCYFERRKCRTPRESE